MTLSIIGIRQIVLKRYLIYFPSGIDRISFNWQDISQPVGYLSFGRIFCGVAG
jgi:hypothetical protein